MVIEPCADYLTQTTLTDLLPDDGALAQAQPCRRKIEAAEARLREARGLYREKTLGAADVRAVADETSATVERARTRLLHIEDSNAFALLLGEHADVFDRWTSIEASLREMEMGSRRTIVAWLFPKITVAQVPAASARSPTIGMASLRGRARTST